MNISDLAELLSIKYDTLRKNINSMEDKGILSVEKNNGRVAGIYINPYIVWKGGLIQENVLEKFSDTIWAENFVADSSIDAQLSNQFRYVINEWKNESMKFCDYKCVVTGLDFDEIHHVVPYNIILKNVFSKYKVDYNTNYDDIEKEKLEVIKNEIVRIHNLYGYGACLSKPVHTLYHKIYGYANCNHRNFIEFLTRVQSMEYSEYFESCNITVNINNVYLSYLKSLDFIYNQCSV